jgi:serine/threonine protein kinase
MDGPQFCIVYEYMSGLSLLDRLTQPKVSPLLLPASRTPSSLPRTLHTHHTLHTSQFNADTGKPVPKLPSLSWEQRLNIAVDTARGLDYLHYANPPTIHRDVKSANILLTSKDVAKVSDFGTVRAEKRLEANTHITTMNIVGTVKLGYCFKMK